MYVLRKRLELLYLKGTTPSRWRVYQFHHAGYVFQYYRFKVRCQCLISEKGCFQAYPSGPG